VAASPEPQAALDPEAKPSTGPDTATTNPPQTPAAALPGTPEAKSFTLDPVTPPYERTAKESDGQWSPLVEQSSPHSAVALLHTTIHPHELNRFVSLDVVAIDLKQLALHWIVGSKDHLAQSLQPEQTPGLIPQSDQPNTIAIFNGGFQARHGYWGVMSHDKTLLPPKDSGCTVALMRSGEVRLGSWTKLADQRPQMFAFRQGPPCLVEDGQLNPRLETGNTRVWAGSNPTRRTRRRSAAGINADGSVLYFGIGTETDPLPLARGMRAVGAVTAVQLDINWAWARFLLVGRRDELPRVTTSLVPDSLHGKNEYFSWASHRDFFYLTLQDPAMADPAAGD